MGVDASLIMDFHGDGHPNDLTDLRLDELDAYFRALRAQSDPDFLLIPGEEANVHLGGHWALVLSQAGLLVHESAAERRRRLDPSEIRHRLQRGGCQGDVRSRPARGRLHVSDASAHEGVDGVSGSDRGDRALPRCPLSRRRVEGDAVGSVLAAPRRSRVRVFWTT